MTGVRSVRRATPGTRVVRLVPETRFHYRAGQAVQIGPEASKILVPYSLASAPEDTAQHGYLELLVKIDGQGRWGESFDPLRRGQRMRIRGPIGGFAFPERPVERRFLFIAGGTGIAPIRSMIRHALFTVGGTIRLFYSARTPDDFAYVRELRGMARRRELSLTLTATRDVPPTWRGKRGRIAASQLAPLIDDPATLCFVCGPAAMVEDVPRVLTELGIDRSRIRLEEW